jgi:hypothetical protein
MKRFLVCLVLVGCSSTTPLDYMSPQELAALPDEEICYWAKLGDTVATPESRKRGLICDQKLTIEQQNLANEAAMYKALAGEGRTEYNAPQLQQTRTVCQEQVKRYDWEPTEVVCETR